MSTSLELLVTLWPSFEHFRDFACDPRLSGIRLNSAMINNPELEQELALLHQSPVKVPLFFDVKGWQLRVAEVHPNEKRLDVTLNHPIWLDPDCVARGQGVLFKAGKDFARLESLQEGGRRLVFRPGEISGPAHAVHAGESLHIFHPSLKVLGSQFTPEEQAKIEKVKAAGFRRFFLSYVQSQRDVDEFVELVGKESEVWLKIENEKGLRFVETEFQKRPNLVLVAARGDLYVELKPPHQILEAQRRILSKDPEACVGSRLLLSVVQDVIPECSDFTELAWLYDIGYRRMMLCDELCLKRDLLSTAVNAFDAFRRDYAD